jgi:hypothetical protein
MMVVKAHGDDAKERKEDEGRQEGRKGGKEESKEGEGGGRKKGEGRKEGRWRNGGRREKGETHGEKEEGRFLERGGGGEREGEREREIIKVKMVKIIVRISVACIVMLVTFLFFGFRLGSEGDFKRVVARLHFPTHTREVCIFVQALCKYIMNVIFFV